MVLEITGLERELLLELIESAHQEIIREIDHTDTREFRKRLQERLEVLERIRAKVGKARDESVAH